MNRKQVLVSWIGHTDLKAWTEAVPEEAKKILNDPDVKKELKEERFDPEKIKVREGVGPLETVVKSGKFSEIHLLSRLPRVGPEIAKWLGKDVTLHPVERGDPTDHSQIYSVAVKVLSKISNHKKGEIDLNFFLNSGTPAMATILVLLGKTIYQARLWKVSEKELIEIELPFDLSLFEGQARLWRTIAYSRAADSLPESFDPIIGSSATIEDARRRAAVVARHDVCVLLLGETGTGKELFAKAIHEGSNRCEKPYHAINCAALPGQLLESELFGHEKGAFTGADKQKDGLFKQADGGTLFLDEVGECDLGMQAKLLRVLQPPTNSPCQRVFRSVGGKDDLKSDVRIMAATNRNLLDMVSKGTFREDLYYRLTHVTITLPPLRERQSDIPEIAETLLEQISHALYSKVDKKKLRLSKEALRFSQTRRWKGNIRQLYNALLQAAMFTTGDDISLQVLEAATNDVGEAPEQIDRFPFDGKVTVAEYLDNLRDKLYKEALERSQENQAKAAKLLGISKQAVSKYLKENKKA